MHFKSGKSFLEPLKSEQINSQSEDLLWKGKCSELSLVGLVGVFQGSENKDLALSKHVIKLSWKKKEKERMKKGRKKKD